MKTAIIVILCIVGYLAIGFCLLVLHGKKYYIEFDDAAIMLFIWPIAILVKGLTAFIEYAKDKARYLSEKLPK